jgi:hypothetical protein
MTKPKQHAHFDANTTAVVIEQLTMTDKDVVREAQRWTEGERGALIDDPDQLARADLTNFATEALRIGSHALSVTGQAQESRALERMLKDVGEKTAFATTQAAEMTGRAAKHASEVVTKAADEARKAITEVDAQSRKEFTTAVATAKGELNTELRRIFAGDSPELLERLQPVLDRFGTDLDAKVSAGTSELLAKAAKQFDPSDPSSPMAKHAAELTARQEQLAQQLNKNHTELAGKVEGLVTALKVQEAKTTLAKVTPIKGDSYATQVHTLMHGIACGLGDEYVDTGAVVGLLPRCKKGDGLLTVDGGAARVALEMTDSARAGWGDYLDEAERNRAAAASLGLVRTSSQNGGQTVRVLGSRRVVMAFDPENDDPDLLRTVVMLMRTAALTASARTGATEIATAEEKVSEALTQLTKIDAVKSLAGSIQKNAAKIESECTSLNSGIRRLLDQALVALAGADSAAEMAPIESARDGAA